MPDFQSGDHQPDFFTGDVLFDGFGDGPGNNQHFLQQVIGEIEDIIDCLFGDEQGVSHTNRAHIQKGVKQIILVEFGAGNLAGKNAGKNGAYNMSPDERFFIKPAGRQSDFASISSEVEACSRAVQVK